jgi:hypothetical protein
MSLKLTLQLTPEGHVLVLVLVLVLAELSK